MEVLRTYPQIKELIDRAESIVFLGGAGTSTESGIPDFRSGKGLYNQPHKFSPEKILSHNFFMNQPLIFYEYYKENLIHTEAKPHIGHYYLAKLEKQGKLKTIITQNIDELHQQAGSKNVIELHGSIYRNECIRCHKKFDIQYIENNFIPVRCNMCNGLVKPDVVLYGEQIKTETLLDAIKAIVHADLLIISGTSLTVAPAVDLIKYAQQTLLLNLSRTSNDIYFDYVHYGKFGEVCQGLEDLED